MAFILRHDHTDHILDGYREALGTSFTAYRNHVYRLLNFVDLLMPRNLTDVEIEKLAIAAAFHDIAIWTEDTFDYLDPSITLALEYLVSIHREEWRDEIESTIRWHHKITAYRGPYAESVELFRQADWIDVTRGLRHFGVDRMDIVKLYSELPAKGFHIFLLKRGLAYAVRHPFRPLPMFRK